MKLKTTFFILGAVLLSTFVSCLGSSDTYDVTYSPDAEIVSFSIKNDSIDTALKAISFSIDQLQSEIYNKDSANFGLVLTEKVILTFSTVSGYNILNVTDGDSTWVASGDSIDFSKTLILRSYAATGEHKDYTVKFNIHQIDPDSIWWQQVNSNLDFLGQDETKTFLIGSTFYCFSKSGTVKLYTSTDNAVSWTDNGNLNLPFDAVLSQIQQFGKDSLFVCTSSGDLYRSDVSNSFISWSKISSTTPVTVKNVFGTVAKKNLLAIAAEKKGILYSMVCDGKTILELMPNDTILIPSEMPVSAFSSISYERTNSGHLTIAGGTSSTSWGTTNGLYWAQVGNLLPLNVQGTNVFKYNDNFYLLNGITGSTYNTSVYTSIDGTNTWQLSPSKTYLPGSYTFRTDASVVVGSDNIIYIIGGKNGNNPVTDIWRGRLNKLN